jgi:hypothetical protein
VVFKTSSHASHQARHPIALSASISLFGTQGLSPSAVKSTHASCLITRKFMRVKLSFVAALPRASGLLVALLPRSPSRISVEDSTRTCSSRDISSVLRDLCSRRTDRSVFYAFRLSLKCKLARYGRVLQQSQSFSVMVDVFQQCIIGYVGCLMLGSWCYTSLQRVLL